MLRYRSYLKPLARRLRNDMTDAERRLWLRLRSKQVLDVQFYRQKPIGQYIVDFYAPAAQLVVEVDGGQHFEDDGMQSDADRDRYLGSLGLSTLRFSNLDVLQALDAVVDEIAHAVETRKKIPLAPFSKGGTVTAFPARTFAASGGTVTASPFEKGGLRGIYSDDPLTALLTQAR